MTIDEKIDALDKYCRGHVCGQCPLEKWPEDDCAFDEWTDDRIEEAYDAVFNPPGTVDHPNHYNREGAMECIDEMVLIFGREAVMYFCLCNAWKYRYRATDKNGVEDLKKSDWYMAKYKELKGGESV